MDIRQKIVKRPWLFLFVILFVGVIIFTQFYEVGVIVRKKSLAPFSKSNETFSPEISGEEKEKTKNPVSSQINPENISLDLENLTEEETASVKAFLKFKKIKAQIIPSGVPDVYGQELAVNFDQVQESMNKMRGFGPTYGEEGQKITLTGKNKERYINITSQTSCEHCCGAKALVREDGQAACGCAHSIVMRGLAAYLIKNHPQLSDEEVLAEIKTWKRSFFPKQTLTATLQSLKESGEEDVEQVLEEFPDFLPRMVGGC